MKVVNIQNGKFIKKENVMILCGIDERTSCSYAIYMQCSISILHIFSVDFFPAFSAVACAFGTFVDVYYHWMIY